MNEYIACKANLIKLTEEIKKGNTDLIEEIYQLCLQDKVKAHDHMELTALCYLLLTYKWNKFCEEHTDVNFYFYLKNFKDNSTVEELYYLLRRTNHEILMTMIENDDPIDENTKVDFLKAYAEFLFRFFRQLKCVDICNCILFRDSENSTANFFKVALLDIVYIVEQSPHYNFAVEMYRQDLIKRIDYNKIAFDKRIASLILNGLKLPIKSDSLEKRLYCLCEIDDDFINSELGKTYWNSEKDYYLKRKLYLNPLNNFGRFIQATQEQLLPLAIPEECQTLFDSIIDDYKYSRKKLFEYVVEKKITKREACAAFSFTYSIFDKIAYVLKKVYNIDVDEDRVYFTQDALFDRKFNNSNKKFYELKNPAIIPLYLEMTEARNKHKVKGLDIGTYGHNEFRNNIEHKSTSLVKEENLINQFEFLVSNIRNLILETYILLKGSKKNLSSDELVLSGTAYVKALFLLSNSED